MRTKNHIWLFLPGIVGLSIATLIGIWQIKSNLGRAPARPSPSSGNTQFVAEIERQDHPPTTEPDAKPPATQPTATPPASQPDETLVKFFGITDHARKIVFVMDSGPSMFETWGYANVGLIESIAGLHPGQQFEIVLYPDDRAISLDIGGKKGLFPATPENKKACKTWMNMISGGGSGNGATDARAALEQAFRIEGGPPELIFFLSDGMIPKETINKIAALNSGHKVRVDTIAWLDERGKDLQKKIAEQNGGQYRFVTQKMLDDEFGQEY